MRLRDAIVFPMLAAVPVRGAEPVSPYMHVAVGSYDLDVPVVRPATPAMAWLDLYRIGFAAGGPLFRTDTCTTHYSGAVLDAVASNGAMRFCGEYANLPPAGPVPGLDYLIAGSITSSNLGSPHRPWL